MTATPEFSGVLLVDKPVGPTSFDVVKAVRRLLHVKSAGHTGTLDPNASGLLPVCVGDATKIASFVTEGEKEYEALVRFGIETDTLDVLGTVVRTRDASHLQRGEVERAIAGLLGTQAQAAPMYSARKVDGKRLYELARAGQEVEREARDITVHEARLLSWNPPDASVLFRCSKGTYIRVLAETLGSALEVGAHLAALRRTASGPLRVSEALPLARLEQLGQTDRPALLALLRPVEAVLADMPQLRLDERTAISVAFGNPVEPAVIARASFQLPPMGSRLALVEPSGNIVAVGEPDERGWVRLVRVLRPRVGPGNYRRDGK